LGWGPSLRNGFYHVTGGSESRKVNEVGGSETREMNEVIGGSETRKANDTITEDIFNTCTDKNTLFWYCFYCKNLACRNMCS
jgi:hypothetical protein